MKSFFKQNNNKNKGVSLVEALVAITIFTTAIMAMVTVIGNGLASTGYAKTKNVASFLSQEGIEYIRNLRDTYVLYDSGGSANGWTGFKNKLAGASCPSGCYFDPSGLDYSNSPAPTQPMKNLTLTACSGACPPLRYDSSTGKYGYSGGVDIGFRRKITTTQITSDEIKIVSDVSWTQGSGTYNMIFSESIFNWME